MTAADVLDYLRENYIMFIVFGFCGLPILFVTRRYSVPLILYTIEICLYWSVMHAVIATLVRVTRWFKESSSMRALKDGRPDDAPDWTSPYLTFWDTTAYRPEWIWKMEVVLAILVLAAVIRYRPMKVQKARDRRYDDSGKKMKRGASGWTASDAGNPAGRRRR